MADLEISKLPTIAGSLLQPTDPLPMADLSASETKQVTIKDLIQSGIALIDPGSIPPDKLNYTIPVGSVGTTELLPKAVTAAKLADNSSATVGFSLPATGSFIGQLALDSTANKLYIWSGSAWVAFKAAGSLNTLLGATFGPLTTSIVQSADTATITAKLTNSTGASQFLAGPAAGAGAVALRNLTSEDLPRATASAIGGVSVPIDSGLRVEVGPTGLGALLQINNSVAANGTPQLVTYDTHGLVTGGRALTAGDLPTATAGSIGAISPGTEFTVQPSGVLQHRNQLTAGTGTKISYDAQGHVTGASALAATDIPNLDATKLTTGTLPADRIGTRSITQGMLADYAISFIQEAAPPSANNYHNGMLWFQESVGQLRMWNGNSWFPVGFGRLSAENLRYCGIFNAATGVVTGVTQFGVTEGLAIGGGLPAASDAHAGMYLVASTPGSGTSVAAGVTFDNGDWILCNGRSGWVRIDTLNGSGGGGGGASTSVLNDLLDVTLTAPTQNQLLAYSATGQWVNLALSSLVGDASTTAKGIAQLADAAALTAGTATRVVTADQLKTTNTTLTTATTNITHLQTSVTTLQGLTVDATDAAKGVVELATAAEVTAGTDNTRAITPAALKAGFTVPAPAIPDATEAVKGVVELATDAEVATGLDALRAVTPASLKAAYLPKAGGAMTGVVEVAPGTAALPGVAFAGDTDTGLYSAGANQVGLVAGGVQRLGVDSLGRVVVPGAAVGTPAALTDGATVTPDFSLANNFTWTMATVTARTLANPTNLVAGQSGCIIITNSSTSTLAYGTAWKFAGGTKPTLPTSATSVLTYYVASSTLIVANLVGDVK